MDQQQQAGPQANNQQVLMQMIQQLTQGQQQLQQALQESASQQTQATARMAQAFQANMDQQLKIHQNVEKSIDVRDWSELKGIPKPEKFAGASGTWDSWFYKLKTWVESCHKNAIQVIQKLESTVDVAITERSLEDEGEALEIAKNTSRESPSQLCLVGEGLTSPAVLFGQASRRARKLGELEEEVWGEKEEATGGRYLP